MKKLLSMKFSKSPRNLYQFFSSLPGLLLVLTILNLLLFGIMQLVSFRATGGGFPLDDSWIHQTYAKGIAQTGSWVYGLNGRSAGSTSPLWTLFLVPGHLLSSSNPFGWTFTITWLFSAALLLLSTVLLNRLVDHNLGLTAIFGAALSMEWHLLWAVGSGMEILLLGAGFIAILYLLKYKTHYALIGLLTGSLVFVRLEGISILGPVLLLMVLDLKQKKIKTKDVLLFMLLLVIPILLYGWHNYHLSGSIFPNTLAAKSTEYASLTSTPLLLRYIKLFSVLLIGPSAFLLPGFIYAVWHAWKSKDAWLMAVMIWLLGFVLLYAVRLPVTYQHGRYLVPALPVYMLLGYLGTVELLRIMHTKTRRLLGVFLYGSLLITSVIFYLQAVTTYREDVNTINALMVEPAVWIDQHTEPGARVAAHDIGAIGYFSNRRIIDLGGLIDPAVTSFILDEAALSDYIRESKANYLVILSDWYRELNTAGDLVKQYSVRTRSGEYFSEIRELH